MAATSKMPASFADDVASGVCTDAELGRKYGVARQTVFRWRKELQLPSSYKRRLTVRDALEQLVHAVESWKQIVPPKVGGALKDAKIALKGVSVERSTESEGCGRPAADA